MSEQTGRPVLLPRDEETFRRLVIDEAYSRTPPSATEALALDPQLWRDALAAAITYANEQLTECNAEWDAVRAEQVYEPGEFARLRAEHTERRAKLVHFKRKIETRLRSVTVLSGKANGSGKNTWRDFVAWLLEDYRDDEWDGLYETCPPNLLHLLRVADRTCRGADARPDEAGNGA